MTKPELNRKPDPAAATRAQSTPRRTPEIDDRAVTAPPPDGPVSVAMRLAAEVDALRAALAESQAKIAELEAFADIDPLTEVLNRRGFERELRRAIAYVDRYGSRAALIYLDLDGFKPINDQYGHAAGDAMLKTVSAVLGQHVRASDVVGRIGGDEFVVLLWNLEAPVAVSKAVALEAAIAGAEVSFGGYTLAVGASAGVTMLSGDDAAESVLSRADMSMYKRKSSRRNSSP